MRWLVVAICLATSSVAFAQAPGETSPQMFVQAAPLEPPKKVWVAYMWSLGATTIPLTIGALAMPESGEGRRADIAGGLMTAALVLGPSVGHWYADGEITPGLMLRTAGAGTIAGIVLLQPDNDVMGIMAMVLGAHAIIGGTVWDFVTLPRSVRRYNRAHQITPAVMPGGIAVAGRF